MDLMRTVMTVVLMLGIVSGSASAPAQSLDLAQALVPVEDLGPDWLSGSSRASAEANGQMLSVRYVNTDGGTAHFTILLAEDEATAQDWVDLAAAREGATRGFDIVVAPSPGLGDGQAFRFAGGEFTAAGHKFRVGKVGAVVALEVGYADPAWNSILPDPRDPEFWKRYMDLLDQRAREFALMQEGRLRHLLSDQPFPAPAAPHCGTGQRPTIDARFAPLTAGLGERVGEPLECAYGDAELADWWQHTTGGLLVWRKAERIPAFSDTDTTWLFGPEGLVSRPSSGPLFAWEVGRVRAVVVAEFPKAIMLDTWNPDGTRLATSDSDGEVRLWDTASWQTIWTTQARQDTHVTLGWSPSSTRLTGVSSRAVQVLDAASGNELCSVPINNYYDKAVSAVWSPDGSRLALAPWRGPIVPIVDASTCRELEVLRGHEGDTATVDSVAWSPDGARLATGAWDTTARVWDAATGEQQAVLGGHSRGWIRVDWSPDGRLISTYQFEGDVQLWDPNTGQVVRTLPLDGRSNIVAWSPNGRWLATGNGLDVAIWDPDSGSSHTLPRTGGAPRSVRWSPDSALLLVDDTRVWRADPLRLLWIVGNGQATRWSPDGLSVMSTAGGTALRWWDLRAGVYGSP